MPRSTAVLTRERAVPADDLWLQWLRHFLNRSRCPGSFFASSCRATTASGRIATSRGWDRGCSITISGTCIAARSRAASPPAFRRAHSRQQSGAVPRRVAPRGRLQGEPADRGRRDAVLESVHDRSALLRRLQARAARALRGHGDLPDMAMALEGKGFREWLPAALDWLASVGKPLLVGFAAPCAAPRDRRLFRSSTGPGACTCDRMAAAADHAARRQRGDDSAGLLGRSGRELAPRPRAVEAHDRATRASRSAAAAMRSRRSRARSSGSRFRSRPRRACGTACSPKSARITPTHVGAADLARLRTCGLSGQKSAYLLDLAQRFSSGALEPARWSELDDEALIAELTQVKGIGRWTAEMFLIFYMARPDVLPLDDIGLQRAMSLHYNAGRPLSKLKMRRIGKRGRRGARSPRGISGAASTPAGRALLWNTPTTSS